MQFCPKSLFLDSISFQTQELGSASGSFSLLVCIHYKNQETNTPKSMKVHNSKNSAKKTRSGQKDRGIIHHIALYPSKEEDHNLAVRWF